MDHIIRLLSIRSLRDAIVVPLTLAALIVLVALGLDRVLFGADPAPIQRRIAHAVLTTAPFKLLALVAITHLDRTLRRTARLSRLDPLTGLANRRAFLEVAEIRVASAPSSALIALDVDHFKMINDTHGHAAGDACLVAVARAIRRRARSEDLTGRLGGEEFAILLSGATLEEAREVADRLIAPIEVAIPNRAAPIRLTMSAGVTAFRPELGYERAFRQADRALYAAKESGRARYEIWGAINLAQQAV